MDYEFVTYISEIKRNLQVLGESVGELRVHLENVQQIVTENFVQIAVGQGAYVTTRLSHCLVL